MGQVAERALRAVWTTAACEVRARASAKLWVPAAANGGRRWRDVNVLRNSCGGTRGPSWPSANGKSGDGFSRQTVGTQGLDGTHSYQVATASFPRVALWG